jgi:plasmid maintenance system killer protein
MIKSFANEITEEVFHGVHTHAVRKKFAALVLKSAERKLDMLNSAESWESLCKVPTHQSDAVRDAKGKYSIPIQGEWRLAFRWNEGPEDVEIKS